MKKLALALILSLAAVSAVLFSVRARASAPPAPPAAPRGPAVIAVSPEGLVDGAPAITALFDRPMIGADQVGTETGVLTVDPPVAGRAVWVTASAVELRPDRLEPATAYTARALGREWTFRTEGLRVRASVDEIGGRTSTMPVLRVTTDRPLENLSECASLGVDFDVRRTDAGYELRPRQPLRHGSSWTWTLHRGLRSGALRLEKDLRFPFQVCEPLRVDGIRAVADPDYGSSVIVDLNNPVGPRRPKCVHPVSSSWDEIRVRGEFAPRSTPVIHLRDIEDAYGNTIDQLSFTAVIPDYAPEFTFRRTDGVLERAHPRFPVRFVNLATAWFRFASVQPDRWRTGNLENLPWEERTVSDAPNQIRTFGFPMPAGLVLFEVRVGDQRRLVRLQVTDLAIHAKTSAAGGVVWTTALSTGEPVSANVEARDEKGRTLWIGTTDGRGLAALPPLPKAAYVLARTAEDVAILDLEEDEIPLWRHDVAYEDDPADLLIHAFTDRGIYRPGDTVRVHLTLRAATAEGLRAALDPVTVCVIDPRDRIVLREKRSPGRHGTIAFEYRHREREPQGTYRIRVGEECVDTFRVESYRPAPFEVSVAKVGDDPFRASWSARYFFGTPVDAKFTWRLTMSETGFEPPGFSGFGFGDTTGRPAWIGERSGAGPFTQIQVPKRREPVRVSLEGEATDASHQSASAESSWIVHPSPVYLGLKAPRVAEAGSDVRVGIVASTIDGRGLPLVARVQVVRREWHTVARKSAGGALAYEVVHVDHPVADAYLPVPTLWSFRPARSGEYLVRAEFGIALTVVRVWVSGGDAAGWPYRDDQRLQLVADRETYRVGDVAKILVPSPFEKATALVTVEREGVFEARVVELGTSSKIEIPIEARHAPDIFVSVVLIRDRTHLVGYATLPVVDDSRRIAVEVTASKKHYEPREEVVLNLKTSAPAELAVLVVDEAVLALIGQDTPDPLAFFSRPRPLGVRSAELRRNVLTRTPYDEFGRKGAAGGGGGDKDPVRSRFVPTIHYQILECDGSARVSFRLADDLTRYRVMVLAIGEGDAYGSAQSSIVVRKPLFLTSAMPRFARAGDRFEARVLVHAEEDGEVEVAMNGERQTVPVRAGRVTAVAFPTRTPKRGFERFRFSAAMGAHRDALEIEIPVLPAGAVETRVIHGRSSGSFTLEAPLDEMEVVISASPIVELLESFHYVLEYPHGCIEQTTSRTLPLLAVNVGEDGPMRTLFRGDVRPYVAAGIERILSMQVDGGFSYWPGGSEPNLWGTVYATHALVLASQQGYPVDGLDQALRDVSRLLRTDADGTVRAYGTYVLHLAGRPEPGYVDSLSRRGDLTRTARAFLVLAGGRPNAATAVDAHEMYSDLHHPVELLADPRPDRAEELLASRQGGRWSKTTSNAFAILALARVWREAKAAQITTPFGRGSCVRYEGPSQSFTAQSDRSVYWMIRARGESSETRWLDRGIAVFREIPSEVRAGDTITVRLRLIVRNPLRYVAIADPLSAGLEPLLETNSFRMERRDDRVMIYRDDLPQGIHEFTYRLRATTPGTYALPPTRAEAMYRPDVFGSTAGGTVTVR